MPNRIQLRKCSHISKKSILQQKCGLYIFSLWRSNGDVLQIACIQISHYLPEDPVFTPGY